MAPEYRYTFGTDVVVDLIGYRRHGHSEVDDPTITQPLLYKAIKEHPPLWEIYAEAHRRRATAQARVADAISAELDAAQKARQAAHQEADACASCRPTGTPTRAAGTSREYEVDDRPRRRGDRTRSPSGSRRIPTDFTSTPR